MKWHASSLFLLRAALAVAPLLALAALAAAQEPSQPVRLPEARREGAMPFEAALWARRSIRDLKPDAITLADAAQNIYLQAAALGLGTTFMAGYNDSAMTRVLAADERPMGVMPVGKPR